MSFVPIDFRARIQGDAEVIAKVRAMGNALQTIPASAATGSLRGFGNETGRVAQAAVAAGAPIRSLSSGFIALDSTAGSLKQNTSGVGAAFQSVGRNVGGAVATITPFSSRLETANQTLKGTVTGVQAAGGAISRSGAGFTQGAMGARQYGTTLDAMGRRVGQLTPALTTAAASQERLGTSQRRSAQDSAVMAGRVAGLVLSFSLLFNAVDEARGMTDALTEAQNRVRQAQQEYNAAVQQFGPRSAQATQALMALEKAETALAFQTRNTGFAVRDMIPIIGLLGTQAVEPAIKGIGKLKEALRGIGTQRIAIGGAGAGALAGGLAGLSPVMGKINMESVKMSGALANVQKSLDTAGGASGKFGKALGAIGLGAFATGLGKVGLVIALVAAALLLIDRNSGSFIKLIEKGREAMKFFEDFKQSVRSTVETMLPLLLQLNPGAGFLTALGLDDTKQLELGKQLLGEYFNTIDSGAPAVENLGNLSATTADAQKPLFSGLMDVAKALGMTDVAALGYLKNLFGVGGASSEAAMGINEMYEEVKKLQAEASKGFKFTGIQMEQTGLASEGSKITSNLAKVTEGLSGVQAKYEQFKAATAGGIEDPVGPGVVASMNFLGDSFVGIMNSANNTKPAMAGLAEEVQRLVDAANETADANNLAAAATIQFSQTSAFQAQVLSEVNLEYANSVAELEKWQVIQGNAGASTQVINTALNTQKAALIEQSFALQASIQASTDAGVQNQQLANSYLAGVDAIATWASGLDDAKTGQNAQIEALGVLGLSFSKLPTYIDPTIDNLKEMGEAMVFGGQAALDFSQKSIDGFTKFTSKAQSAIGELSNLLSAPPKEVKPVEIDTEKILQDMNAAKYAAQGFVTTFSTIGAGQPGPLEEWFSKLPTTVSKHLDSAETAAIQGIAGIQAEIAGRQTAFELEVIVKGLPQASQDYSQWLSQMSTMTTGIWSEVFASAARIAASGNRKMIEEMNMALSQGADPGLILDKLTLIEGQMGQKGRQMGTTITNQLSASLDWQKALNTQQNVRFTALDTLPRTAKVTVDGISREFQVLPLTIADVMTRAGRHFQVGLEQMGRVTISGPTGLKQEFALLGTQWVDVTNIVANTPLKPNADTQPVKNLNTELDTVPTHAAGAGIALSQEFAAAGIHIAAVTRGINANIAGIGQSTVPGISVDPTPAVNTINWLVGYIGTALVQQTVPGISVNIVPANTAINNMQAAINGMKQITPPIIRIDITEANSAINMMQAAINGFKQQFPPKIRIDITEANSAINMMQAAINGFQQQFPPKIRIDITEANKAINSMQAAVNGFMQVGIPVIQVEVTQAADKLKWIIGLLNQIVSKTITVTANVVQTGGAGFLGTSAYTQYQQQQSMQRAQHGFGPEIVTKRTLFEVAEAGPEVVYVGKPDSVVPMANGTRGMAWSSGSGIGNGNADKLDRIITLLERNLNQDKTIEVQLNAEGQRLARVSSKHTGNDLYGDY